MFTSVKKIFLLLSKHEQKQLYGIFVVIIITGVLEVVGIGSILPFLAVASNPKILQTNKYLHWGFELFGFSSPNSFLVVLGVLTIVVLVITQTAHAFTDYLINTFTQMRQYSLSVRLFHKYLHEPYIYFLNHNSAGLNRTILAETMQVIRGVLMPGTEFIAKAVNALFILGLVFSIDPFLAVVVVLVLGGVYLSIFMVVRNTLGNIGHKRLKANRNRFKIPAEAFGGIKDVKLLRKEDIFVQKFAHVAQKFSQYTVYNSLIGSLPHYAINMIAFSGLLMITIYLIAVKENFQQALPIIGLYAFAGYKLMPIIRGMYSQLTTIRFNLPATDLLYNDLQGSQIEIDSINMTEVVHPLPFKNKLELSNIVFHYPNVNIPIFNGLNWAINVNTSVGIVGVTGCGKTTLIDIILGLLKPQNGMLVVDGVEINDATLFSWQQNLGYVPQQIFLCDDTVTRNIAFGVPDSEIDPDAVERAARIANLHEFVVSELPYGYDTVVGERGVRLSGGERQRVGIARALYHDPSFLIFDEATSSLDNLTEIAVMEAINNLAGRKTIIMIAHRLTTVKACDIIYMMEKGKIIAQGDYDTLIRTSAEFQKMASVIV